MMENHDAPRVAKAPTGIPTKDKRGKTFIGGGAQEFAQGPTPPNEFADDPRTGVMSPPKLEEKSDGDAETRECVACGERVTKAHLYCGRCGAEQESGNYQDALSIKLTDDDLSEYLFKGALSKEVTVAQDKKAVFKTLTSKESDEIEGKLYEMFRDKDTTQNHYVNRAVVLNLSYGWVQFGGQGLGDSAEERLERIDGFGVHLIDIVSKKWTLFNRAVGAMLENSDIIKN